MNASMSFSRPPSRRPAVAVSMPPIHPKTLQDLVETSARIRRKMWEEENEGSPEGRGGFSEVDAPSTDLLGRLEW